MESKEDLEGARVGGQNNNNLTFADDVALISDSQQNLQELLNQVNRESDKKGLRVNTNKTFCIVICKKRHSQL